MAKRKKPAAGPVVPIVVPDVSYSVSQPAGLKQWLDAPVETPDPSTLPEVLEAIDRLNHKGPIGWLKECGVVSPASFPPEAPKNIEQQPATIPTHSEVQEQVTDSTSNQGMGDTATVMAVAFAEPTVHARGPIENRMAAKNRWIREDRLPAVEQYMDGKRSEYRDTGMARHRANDLAWEAAIAEFPPPGVKPSDLPAPHAEDEKRMNPALLPDSPPASVQGLGAIPPAWLPLPPNASLQVELGWVQANRLLVVEERGNTTTVRLERASTHAPSMAALGWLETSIRSYAKYIDIMAKSLAVVDDEQEQVRHERMQQDDIRALLREMQPNDRCPTCGRVREG